MRGGVGYHGAGVHALGVQRIPGYGGVVLYRLRPRTEDYRRQGKVFNPSADTLQLVRALPEVDVWTETIEENAMIQYKDRQVMAVVKGVDDNFQQLTSIDSLLYGVGSFMLHDADVDYGLLGIELASE